MGGGFLYDVVASDLVVGAQGCFGGLGCWTESSRLENVIDQGCIVSDQAALHAAMGAVAKDVERGCRGGCACGS